MTDPQSDNVTIGEALEAAAVFAGDKAVDKGDAAAIQAAEVRATGLGHVVQGGIGAAAQAAAARNRNTEDESEKTKLGDVLADTTSKLTDDKPATRDDAEGVIKAEIRNKEDRSGGEAAYAVAAAASINQTQSEVFGGDRK